MHSVGDIQNTKKLPASRIVPPEPPAFPLEIINFYTIEKFDRPPSSWITKIRLH